MTMSRGRTVAGSIAATSAMVLSGALVAPVAAAGGTPGGQSAGDSLFPTIGNTGYDARHYDIRLRYARSTRSIVATTTLTARATKPLSSFSLDLQGLHVRGVSVAGRPAGFTRHDDKLVVTPAHPVSGVFTTRVRYAGKPVTHHDPDGSDDGWIPTSDGGATVVSEPLGSMTWFPSNDTPRDKATYDVRVDAPSTYKVAGNGDLAGRRVHGDRTTWHWSQRRPQATYLTMISIGRYHLYRSTVRTAADHRLPVWTFVAPRYGSQLHARRLVPRALRFLERRFGPYPFTSTGLVIAHLGVGYALETQDRPTFDGAPDDVTVVHELAHQWYGDSVTPRDWQDVWLNEGFATYAEDLWTAGHGGRSTAAAFRARYAAHPASDPLWSPAPARFSNPVDLFGEPVYLRGGMALQALRARIGSADFFRVLHRWAAAHRYGTVTTPQLRALAERVSGRRLDGLFHDWLYVARRPKGY